MGKKNQKPMKIIASVRRDRKMTPTEMIEKTREDDRKIGMDGKLSWSSVEWKQHLKVCIGYGMITGNAIEDKIRAAGQWNAFQLGRSWMKKALFNTGATMTEEQKPRTIIYIENCKPFIDVAKNNVGGYDREYGGFVTHEGLKTVVELARENCSFCTCERSDVRYCKTRKLLDEIDPDDMDARIKGSNGCPYSVF